MNEPTTLNKVPMTCLACKRRISADCERRPDRDRGFEADGNIVYVYRCPECNARPWLIISRDDPSLESYR